MVAGNFPIIPQGLLWACLCGLVCCWQPQPFWWNYGELWAIGELWGKYGCHVLCCWLLFAVVAWRFDCADMSDFRPHNISLYVLVSDLYKAPREYISQGQVAKQMKKLNIKVLGAIVVVHGCHVLLH